MGRQQDAGPGEYTVLARVFEDFRGDRLVGGSLNADELTEILRGVLDQRTGGTPRHATACELMARFRFETRDGREQKLTGSLVASTLRTIRKRLPELEFMRQPTRRRSSPKRGGG